MASVLKQRHCKVCDIWVESTGVRTHWASQPHVDMCKRKHYHPRDRALPGDGACDKPSHTPEATLSEPAPPTTATGTSTMYQPKSCSASSSIPASDPNRTSQQYIRAGTSTLRTIPRAVPQGCFCAACNTQVRISAIKEHLKPTEHTA